jgi:hypothetical protein
MINISINHNLFQIKLFIVWTKILADLRFININLKFSLFLFGPQSRKRLHNQFFVSFIICVQILKSITAILMKQDKYRLLLIGDFNYFLNGRRFKNSVVIIWGSLTLSSQLLHYWKYSTIQLLLMMHSKWCFISIYESLLFRRIQKIH